MILNALALSLSNILISRRLSAVLMAESRLFRLADARYFVTITIDRFRKSLILFRAFAAGRRFSMINADCRRLVPFYDKGTNRASIILHFAEARWPSHVHVSDGYADD